MWERVWVADPLSLHWWSHTLLLVKRWTVAWCARRRHTTHMLLTRWAVRCSMLLVYEAPVSRHAIRRHTVRRRAIRILSRWWCSRCTLHTRI